MPDVLLRVILLQWDKPSTVSPVRFFHNYFMQSSNNPEVNYSHFTDEVTENQRRWMTRQASQSKRQH